MNELQYKYATLMDFVLTKSYFFGRNILVPTLMRIPLSPKSLTVLVRFKNIDYPTLPILTVGGGSTLIEFKNLRLSELSYAVTKYV
jgi:hypothetical protein